MADNIRRALQNIDLGIDDTPFTLPHATVQRAADENRFCLIGRPLIPRKQNLRQILTSLPRSWGLVGLVRGRIIKNRRFQFVFPSEESLETVLRRGPWSYAERMITLQRWSPDMNLFTLNFIPFWIQIKGIPLQFLNLGVITSIARSLGEVMGTDFDEVTVSRVQFVRVRINWNVPHPLRFQRNYQFIPGENIVLTFFYERLRGFCSVCGMLTHDSGRCLLQNGGPDNSDDDDNEEDQDEYHGNPGVHIQEIEEDDHPAEAIDMADNQPPLGDQPELVLYELDSLFDIDPDHNALVAISSDSPNDVSPDEWKNNVDIVNPIPDFANDTGDTPSPLDFLFRERRKRKQSDEVEDMSSFQKKTAGIEVQRSFQNMEKGSGSGEVSTPTQIDGAAVGPVPPPVP